MVAHIDQNLKKTDGIICDICNQPFVKKFEYYSAKFDLVEVDSDQQKVGPKRVDRRHMDLDFCQGCYNTLLAKVMVNIKQREQDSKTKFTSSS